MYIQHFCGLKRITNTKYSRHRSGKAQNCEKTCSCSNVISDHVIDHIHNISKSSDCQTLCIQNSDCNFYTYYNLKTGISGICSFFWLRHSSGNATV